MTHPADDNTPPPLDRLALRSALQARLAHGRGAARTVELCPEIDRALPGSGLPRAALHEVIA